MVGGRRPGRRRRHAAPRSRERAGRLASSPSPRRRRRTRSCSCARTACTTPAVPSGAAPWRQRSRARGPSAPGSARTSGATASRPTSSSCPTARSTAGWTPTTWSTSSAGTGPAACRWSTCAVSVPSRPPCRRRWPPCSPPTARAARPTSSASRSSVSDDGSWRVALRGRRAPLPARVEVVVAGRRSEPARLTCRATGEAVATVWETVSLTVR